MLHLPNRATANNNVMAGPPAQSYTNFAQLHDADIKMALFLRGRNYDILIRRRGFRKSAPSPRSAVERARGGVLINGVISTGALIWFATWRRPQPDREYRTGVHRSVILRSQNYGNKWGKWYARINPPATRTRHSKPQQSVAVRRSAV